MVRTTRRRRGVVIADAEHTGSWLPGPGYRDERDVAPTILFNGAVRTVRYGVAGLNDSKDLEGSIAKVVEGGYAACEVQFVKEFTLKEPEAERLGTIAAREGVRLSVHAPYFAQLTTPEPERLTLHLGALHHSCHLA